MIARVALVASLLALGACSTGKDESWIGRNAGVVIDSEGEARESGAATEQDLR